MALEKATLMNLMSGEEIAVQFNPEEYSLDSGNAFAEFSIPGAVTPPVQYVRGQGRTLKMELLFDTYGENRDVRELSGRVIDLLEPDPQQQGPPVLLFLWGGFQFRCVLESAGQQFTMFTSDGVPARVKMSVIFKEYAQLTFEVEQGFFAGPPLLHTVVSGETLTQIAAGLMGDPSAWRELAEANGIENPLELPAGTSLQIPGS